jgi:uncharacterized protein (DUF169 family)
MADLKSLDQALNTYIRPLTFPLAIKMLKSEEEIPERTKRPLKQMGKKIAICQGIGMARKYGWTVAMGKEDMHCSLGAAPFGFFKNIDFFEEGNLVRLIHGALYKDGGAVHSSAMGRLGCAAIITAIKNDECRYLVPGNGDRIFGMTQDYEMAFLLPPSKVDALMEGLTMTHKAGVRYPITSFFDFEATFPPSYQEQMKIWEEAGEL